jgi:hypothetical protein
MGLVAQIKIAMVLVVLATGGLGYAYVKKLERDLQTARENVVKMELAVKTSEESLERLQVETQRVSELNQKLQGDLQKAEQYGDELRATLQRHNLTHLATKKPGLIEERMQNATDKLWDDLLDITNPDVVQPSEGTGDSNSNEN